MVNAVCVCVQVFECMYVCVLYLASSLATESLGQVTKAAECVPDEYVCDAMENVRNPTNRSTASVKILNRTV